MAFVGQVLDESPVGVAVLGAGDDRIDGFADPVAFDGPFGVGKIAGGERFEQERLDLA